MQDTLELPDLQYTAIISNLVRKVLPKAFESPERVLTELMQNARRAGATFVAFQYFESLGQQGLVVIDDGEGIDDMQNLLTVAQSGWDEQLAGEEDAFGVGFSVALYTANRVKVESGGRVIEVHRDDVLEQRVIKQRQSLFEGGTRITLWLPESFRKLDEALRYFASGFPIPVIFNGRSLPRPAALSSVRAMPTELGHLSLVGMHRPGEPVYATEYYYQGLPIGVHSSALASSNRSFRPSERNFLHLDHTKVSARAPDRSHVLDPARVLKWYEDIKKQAWREYILGKRASLSDQQFAERYWRVAASAGVLEVMNDVDHIPLQAMKVYCEVPILTPGDYAEEELWAFSERGINRAALQYEPKARLFEHCFDTNETSNWDLLTVAFKQGWLFLPDTLPQGHWAKPLLMSQEMVEVSRVESEPHGEGNFSGHCPYVDVKVVDSYKLEVKWLGAEGQPPTIETMVVDDIASVFDDGCECIAVIPAKSGGIEALERLTTWETEWEVIDSWRDEDIASFRIFLASLRRCDPCLTVRDILLEAGACNFKSIIESDSFIVRLRGPEDQAGQRVQWDERVQVATISASRYADLLSKYQGVDHALAEKLGEHIVKSLFENKK